MKKILKSFLVLASILLLALCNVTKANALVYDKAFYDSMSWIYSYEAPDTPSYNCLGWATGSMTFEWPSAWGEGTNVMGVTTYLRTLKYWQASGNPISSSKIIAYGPSSNKITHFAKGGQSLRVSAKWGQLERFSHSTEVNPYYANTPYGLARAHYN